jgi:hypothetical protein
LRRRVAGLLAVGTLVLTFALSGCASSDALALARQACGHVDKSLALYVRSRAEQGTVADHDRTDALQQLRDGLPSAATAAGEDGQWQALMTTISESSRVPEVDLVQALRIQCAATNSNGAG